MSISLVKNFPIRQNVIRVPIVINAFSVITIPSVHADYNDYTLANRKSMPEIEWAGILELLENPAVHHPAIHREDLRRWHKLQN